MIKTINIEKGDEFIKAGFYTFVGLLWLVFGIWAAVLLLKK